MRNQFIGPANADLVPSKRVCPTTRRLNSGWILFGAALFFAWLILIKQLSVEWQINPQYSYGWIVPLLCLGLLLRRWQTLGSSQVAHTSPGPLRASFLALFALCTFLILPCRLFLEAVPTWRSFNWVLACSVVALTLLLVNRALGPAIVRHFAFPISFFLVAVPWPYSVELPLIQGLTRANVATTIELLAVVGIPAIQHGNLIEVGSGTIGVNEACSGIRSFQSSIMVSLFLGEFFRMGLVRRLTLVPIGFLVAFAFNVCRTLILSWIAAKNGVAAIEEYHDQAGLTILLACTATMWLIAWLLHLKSQKRMIKAQVTLQSADSSAYEFSILDPLWMRSASLILLAWLVLVEVGVELWYRAHENRIRNQSEWALDWPPREQGFHELIVPTVTRDLLKYDEGHSGAWNSPDGANWQMYYFRWLPGHLALAAARSHNPNICLAASGKELRNLDDNRFPVTIGSIMLPFTRYEYEENGTSFYIFHCLWESQAPGQYFDFNPESSEIVKRLQAVWHGQRNLGQRSMEFVLSGIPDVPTAKHDLQDQLQKLIRIVTKGVPSI